MLEFRNTSSNYIIWSYSINFNTRRKLLGVKHVSAFILKKCHFTGPISTIRGLCPPVQDHLRYIYAIFPFNIPYACFRLDSKIMFFSDFYRSYFPLIWTKVSISCKFQRKLQIFFPYSVYNLNVTTWEYFICCKIIVWSFTRFKYLYILRKLYSNSLREITHKKIQKRIII